MEGHPDQIHSLKKNNTENQLFQYCSTRKNNTGRITLEIENVCIMTLVGIYGEI